MEQTLRDRLQRLLTATHSTRETTTQDAEGEPNPNLSIVVVSRPPGSHPTTHWAIAVITNERTRRCRVFHVSDVHILGLRALGWSAFFQDETVGRSSGCQGGVRVGLVERDDLDRLEEAICGNQLPPASNTWDCEDWVLAMIKHLEDQGFMLVTYGMDSGTLMNRLVSDSLRAQRLTERHKSRPVFVPLSLPSAGH
ncbi:hypothetical protein V8D89_008850 [Ganoderma adspersum]